MMLMMPMMVLNMMMISYSVHARHANYMEQSRQSPAPTLNLVFRLAAIRTSPFSGFKKFVFMIFNFCLPCLTVHTSPFSGLRKISLCCEKKTKLPSSSPGHHHHSHHQSSAWLRSIPILFRAFIFFHHYHCNCHNPSDHQA